MTKSFKSAIASFALIAGILSAVHASVRPGPAQAGKSLQDPKAARILRNFQAGRKVLIQTSASQPVLQDFDQAEQLFASGDLDWPLRRLEAAAKREAAAPAVRVVWS